MEPRLAALVRGEARPRALPGDSPGSLPGLGGPGLARARSRGDGAGAPFLAAARARSLHAGHVVGALGFASRSGRPRALLAVLRPAVLGAERRARQCRRQSTSCTPP